VHVWLLLAGLVTHVCKKQPELIATAAELCAKQLRTYFGHRGLARTYTELPPERAVAMLVELGLSHRDYHGLRKHLPGRRITAMHSGGGAALARCVHVPAIAESSTAGTCDGMLAGELLPSLVRVKEQMGELVPELKPLYSAADDKKPYGYVVADPMGLLRRWVEPLLPFWSGAKLHWISTLFD